MEVFASLRVDPDRKYFVKDQQCLGRIVRPTSIGGQFFQ